LPNIFATLKRAVGVHSESNYPADHCQTRTPSLAMCQRCKVKFLPRVNLSGFLSTGRWMSISHEAAFGFLTHTIYKHTHLRATSLCVLTLPVGACFPLTYPVSTFANRHPLGAD
jgi:hypothetical protein